MRVLYACCVVFVSAAFFGGEVRAQSTAPARSVSSCGQCSVLAEKHELQVRKIVALRAAKKKAASQAARLREKRQSKQDRLLVLATSYSDVQAKELAFSKAGKREAAAEADLPKQRKTIEREERTIRADLATLDKALPQAEAAERDAEAKLDGAINVRLSLAQAMTNCEQRCVIASTPGQVIPTAASLTDIAQSNQSAIRAAAQNNAQCRECRQLRTQITETVGQIAEKKKSETQLRQQMTALDRERRSIRTEWRDLYNGYTEKLLARLQAETDGSQTDVLDRDLNRISENIINANARRQRLLTQEGELQDQLMRTGRERDALSEERRRLRAALSACEEVCVAGEKNPVRAGLELASQRVDVSKAEAKCARCGALARLVNDVADTLRARTSERDALEKQFDQIAPALEQIQARRKSIITYAGELADLMEVFRERGDVAQAKRELSQISVRSQKLSTDIIRLLDQREKLDEQIDRNADNITRLSILLRQRRKDFEACEKRCTVATGNIADTVLQRPDLTFRTPLATQTQCDRCAPIAQAIDQFRLLQQSERASLAVAEARLKLEQAHLIRVDQALALNAQSLRNARSGNQARSRSERRNLIDGLRGEAKVVRAEQARLRKKIASSRGTRDTIRARISALDLQIGQQTEALGTCESSCRVVSEAPQTTLSAAARAIAAADKVPAACQDCDEAARNLRDLSSEIRKDRSTLEKSTATATQAARRISEIDRPVRANRTTVLRDVRSWFDLDTSAERERIGKSIIEDAWKTARVGKNVEEAAKSFVLNAASRDKAQSRIAGRLATLKRAVTDLQSCADRCSEVRVSVNDFTEKDPASLIVKPNVPASQQTACATCQAKADEISQLRLQHARAVAKLATMRNVKRSADSILRRIAAKERDIRKRVAALVSERFQSDDDTRKALLKRRLDTLQDETARLDVAKNRQDERVRTAQRQMDAARQQIRSLDRDIKISQSDLRDCEAGCKIASADEVKPDETTGKNVAQLPSVESGDADKSAQNTAVEEDTTSTCARCRVFAKRITALRAERNSRRSERDAAVRERKQVILSIRSISGSSAQKTQLTREREKLTRRIENLNGTIDRLERRMRKLRVSLERCETSCKVPVEVASSATKAPTSETPPKTTQSSTTDADTKDSADPDTAERASENEADDAPATSKRPRRTVIADAEDSIVVVEPVLPGRKRLPREDVQRGTVFGSLTRVLSGEGLQSGAWETSVEIAGGAGNVWVPGTATLSVVPANGSGSRDLKLDATSFAFTVLARDTDPYGPGTVAWGSLEVTRADGTQAIVVPVPAGTLNASRTVDYDKITGTIGLGYDVVGCSDTGGHCSIGLMTGVEHTSLDERITGGVAGQGSTVDGTAALLGVWGDMRIPFAQFAGAGLSLVVKGGAYVKAGYASGDITVAVMGAAQQSSASSAYVGLGADASAELEMAFDDVSLAIGGQVGVDTLPTITGSGGAADIETDASKSSTIYIRGKVKF